MSDFTSWKWSGTVMIGKGSQNPNNTLPSRCPPACLFAGLFTPTKCPQFLEYRINNNNKCYQITILSLLSIFQTWDLKKSLVKIPGDQQWFESSKKARKPEITTFWIEKCPKCLRCPGTQTSQNLVGKMSKNKF